MTESRRPACIGLRRWEHVHQCNGVIWTGVLVKSCGSMKPNLGGGGALASLQ